MVNDLILAHQCRSMGVHPIKPAIIASPLTGLDALAQKVWAAYGVDALTAAEASELCKALAARRVVSAPGVAIPAYPEWGRSGSRPRSSTSLERRRSWAASSWLPPATAARFTQAEAAALGVVMAEIALKGRCELAHGAVSGRAIGVDGKAGHG